MEIEIFCSYSIKLTVQCVSILLSFTCCSLPLTGSLLRCSSVGGLLNLLEMATFHILYIFSQMLGIFLAYVLCCSIYLLLVMLCELLIFVSSFCGFVYLIISKSLFSWILNITFCALYVSVLFAHISSLTNHWFFLLWYLFHFFCSHHFITSSINDLLIQLVVTYSL